MSNRGPYDVGVTNVEDSLIHQSYRGKDYEVAVTEGIYDTKVDTEIGKQKQIIRVDAARELRDYSLES
jgi:hypothetical protein